MSVELLQTIINENDDLKHYHIPAIVVSCSNGKATVQPSIMHRDAAGRTTLYPKIYNVPVIYNRSSDSGITFKLSSGDQGLLVFSDQSLDTWKESKKSSMIDPMDTRRSDLTDAIFIPGLWQFDKGAKIDDEGMTIASGQCKIRFKNNKIAIGNSNNELIQIIADLISTLSTMTVTVAGTTGTVNVIDPDTQALANVNTVITKFYNKIETIKGSL